MQLFIKRLKKTVLIVLLVAAVFAGCILVTNALWWLQDNWAMSELLKNTILWILIVGLVLTMFKSLWEIGKLLWMLIKWLFIEPFKSTKG